jgi:hypothetical protein
LKKIVLYTSLPALLYGRENWNLARCARGITATELECMRKTAGYTWTDYKKIPIFQGMKYNPIFRQNTGPQKNLDAICKQNAS